MGFVEAGDIAAHARSLAEKDVHPHINGAVFKVGIFEDELAVVGRFADDGKGAALAFAQGFEGGESFGQDGHDIAFLRFVAPDLHRAHRAVFVMDVAQMEVAAGCFDEFRETVGEAACADVVDREHWVVSAEGNASVDDLLTTTLHLGVTALDGVEVEGFGLRAGSDRGGGASAETDLHGRTAELDDQRGGWNLFLRDMLALEVPHAASGHDGLVITAVYIVVYGFQGAEKSAELWPAKFVAEGGSADGAFDHDVERAGHAAGVFGNGLFPGKCIAGYVEVGDHEGGESCLGSSPNTGGSFIANFPTDAGGGSGKRRNSGGVVVGLDFAQNVEL